MSRRQALQICLDIAKALLAAHQVNVIHRDIKPDNILLHPNGAKLTDFGIARLEEETAQTQTRAVMGTVPFMAPEQRLSAKNINHQVDIYALTATLFAMLSSESPTDLYNPTYSSSLLYLMWTLPIYPQGLPHGLCTADKRAREYISELEILLG